MSDGQPPVDLGVVNRRGFFRRGMRELLRPVVELAEQVNQPVARLPEPPRPAPAEGRVKRASLSSLPEEGVTIDPYPPEANPLPEQESRPDEPKDP